MKQWIYHNRYNVLNKYHYELTLLLPLQPIVFQEVVDVSVQSYLSNRH